MLELGWSHILSSGVWGELFGVRGLRSEVESRVESRIEKGLGSVTFKVSFKVSFKVESEL